MGTDSFQRLTQLAYRSDPRALDLAVSTKKAQIAVRDAKIALRSAKSAAASSAREELEHNEHVAKMDRIASYMERILDPTFPPELLLSVLEAALASERLRWRGDADSLESAVDEFFHWPPAIDQHQRRMIQRAAAPILPRTATIEIPAQFKLQGGGAMLLTIPKVLQGHEHHIRYLVLDVRLDDRDGASQGELNKTCRAMDGMKAMFAGLKVCTISLLFDNRKTTVGRSFVDDKLRLRNRTSFSQSETLKVSLVRLFNDFYERGPGERKFVRFLDQCPRDGSFAHAGPLVNVSGVAAEVHAANNTHGEDTASGTSSGDENASSSIGARVLDQAYRYHREAILRSGS